MSEPWGSTFSSGLIYWWLSNLMALLGKEWKFLKAGPSCWKKVTEEMFLLKGSCPFPSSLHLLVVMRGTAFFYHALPLWCFCLVWVPKVMAIADSVLKPRAGTNLSSLTLFALTLFVKSVFTIQGLMSWISGWLSQFLQKFCYLVGWFELNINSVDHFE